MKDLSGFNQFFTNYDFGVRKQDQKGNHMLTKSRSLETGDGVPFV